MGKDNHFRFVRMTKPAICIGATLSLALTTGASMAASGIEVQIGRSYMDSASTATVFAEGILAERPLGDSGFNWAPDVSVGWIGGRNLQRYRGARFTTDDGIWLVAAGVRIRHAAKGNPQHGLFLSFQPALHTGKTQALSSVYEFVSTIGWQGERFSFQLRHISNASFHEPNRGETMALLGMRF